MWICVHITFGVRVSITAAVFTVSLILFGSTFASFYLLFGWKLTSKRIRESTRRTRSNHQSKRRTNFSFFKNSNQNEKYRILWWCLSKARTSRRDTISQIKTMFLIKIPHNNDDNLRFKCMRRGKPTPKPINKNMRISKRFIKMMPFRLHDKFRELM